MKFSNEERSRGRNSRTSWAKDRVSPSVVVAEQTGLAVTLLQVPLLSLQSTNMKEAKMQKAAKAANDDLDAYVASVRAYLARSDFRPREGSNTQRSTSKRSHSWQDTNTVKEPRASSATAKELPKKNCTKIPS
jgi:hypothetical protein